MLWSAEERYLLVDNQAHRENIVHSAGGGDDADNSCFVTSVPDSRPDLL